MRVLALDTTTRAGSVALVDADRIVDERGGDESRPYAERLPADLTGLLAAHDLRIADVDLFAVASGPGSFTGMRIGIATIQGLAFVRQRPIVAVSALEALAALGSRDLVAGDFVAAWMDAHRREIFSALYRIGPGEMFADARLAEIEGPAVGAPAATVARWQDHLAGARLTVIGDGAALYGGVAGDASPGSWTARPAPLLAGAIGRIAGARARAGGAVGAAGVQPLYVRRPDAEVARESQALHGGHGGHGPGS